MADAVELLKIIKKVAAETVETGKPVHVLFGKVVCEKPLKINIEQKMELGEAQLILTRNVTEHELEITVDTITEEALSNKKYRFSGSVETAGEPEHTHEFQGNEEEFPMKHTHEIKKKIKVTVHNGLATGDEVILLRQQGGQKYLVVDRIG